MPQVTVELTGDEAALLRSLDRVIAKESSHARQLAKTAAAGDGAGREIESAMDRVQKASDQAMRGLLRDLRKAGPDGRKLATELQSQFSIAGKAGFQSMELVLDQLKKLDPAAAEVAEAIRQEFGKLDQQTEFNDTLEQLRKLGTEGQKIADAIRNDLVGADTAAAADMDAVLKKLASIDPAAGETAERVKIQLGEAAAFAKDRFEETLQKLEQMGPRGKVAADAARTHLATVADPANQSIEEAIASLDEFDSAAGTAARNAARKLEQGAGRGKTAFVSFGESAINQIKSIALAYLGVQEAIQAVIAANQKVIETNKQVFEGLKQNTDGDRRLLQVATSREDFEGLRGNADRLSQEFGIDRQAARNLVFSARSEGFEDALDFIASNQQIIAVDAQAQVAGQVPTLFRSEGLSPQQAIEGTLASAKNSRLSFEQIGSALPGAAEGTSLTGATAAETSGALAALASRFKSADTAADRLKGLALKFDLDTENGLADIGLTAAVKKLESLPAEVRADFLGESQELNTAFKVYLEEMPRIEEFTRSAQQAIDATGTANSPTARGRAISETDQLLRAVVSESRAANALVVEREKRRASAEGERQSREKDTLREAESRNVDERLIGLAETVADLSESFGNQDRASVIKTVTATGSSNVLGDTATRLVAGEGLSTLIRAVTKFTSSPRQRDTRITEPVDPSDLVTGPNSRPRTVADAPRSLPQIDPARLVGPSSLPPIVEEMESRLQSIPQIVPANVVAPQFGNLPATFAPPPPPGGFGLGDDVGAIDAPQAATEAPRALGGSVAAFALRARKESREATIRDGFRGARLAEIFGEEMAGAPAAVAAGSPRADRLRSRAGILSDVDQSRRDQAIASGPAQGTLNDTQQAALARSIERTNELLAQTLELQKKSAAAAEATAKNTRAKPVDMAAATRASARQSDARSAAL